MNLLNKIFVIFTIWIPIWAYFIYQFKTDNKRWYILSSIALWIATTYLVYNPFRIKGLTPWMHYYTFYLMLYLLLIGYKKNWRSFPQVLAMGLLVVFIAGELWEIPVFIYDALGKMGILSNLWTFTRFDFPWWESHIRRLYTLGSVILFLRLTKVNGKIILTLMGATILLSFITLLPFAYQTGPALRTSSELARIFSLALCGYGLYEASIHETV